MMSTEVLYSKYSKSELVVDKNFMYLSVQDTSLCKVLHCLYILQNIYKNDH